MMRETVIKNFILSARKRNERKYVYGDPFLNG